MILKFNIKIFINFIKKEIGHLGEVIWDIVEENGTLYTITYSGDYSTPGI